MRFGPEGELTSLPAGFEVDVTLSQLGHWTDNGAFFFFYYYYARPPGRSSLRRCCGRPSRCNAQGMASSGITKTARSMMPHCRSNATAASEYAAGM